MKRTFTLKHLPVTILTIFFVFTSQISHAQAYFQGFGLQTDVGFFTTEFTTVSGQTSFFTETPFISGAFYKATYTISDNFAISAYPFVGLTGFISSNFGSAISVGIEIPIAVEFYLGHMDDSAFFVGGGLSYAAIGTTGFGSGTIFGPQVSIGGQFPLQGRMIGIRGAFTFGVTNIDSQTEPDVTRKSRKLLSAGIYYPLGI